MYSKSYSSVKLGDKLYGHFQTCSGVRQGDNLSPNLFKIYLNDLLDYFSNSKILLDEAMNHLLFTALCMLMTWYFSPQLLKAFKKISTYLIHTVRTGAVKLMHRKQKLLFSMPQGNK